MKAANSAPSVIAIGSHLAKRPLAKQPLEFFSRHAPAKAGTALDGSRFGGDAVRRVSVRPGIRLWPLDPDLDRDAALHLRHRGVTVEIGIERPEANPRPDT